MPEVKITPPGQKKPLWRRIVGHHLFLPLLCLVVVLLSNLIKTPNFFEITVQNGMLRGFVIDVVNRASELVILAIGMTLVTAASGGQDISVSGIRNGIYRDAVTGREITVAHGNLSFHVGGNSAGIYVLDGPGRIGVDGAYLR